MKEEILIPDEIIEENNELSVEEETRGEGNAPAEKMVPLSVLHKEREEKRRFRDEAKKLGEICERLKIATGAKNSAQLMEFVDFLDVDRSVRQRGLSPEEAKKWVKMEMENRALKRNEQGHKYDREIFDLSGNPLYSDISEVRDEVLEFAKDKGISVKEAYNALFGEARIARVQKEARESALMEKEAKDKKKIHALTSPGAASSGGAVNLSQKEIEIANAAGISPMEYAKFKK